jgi:trehalose 6-phosphate synthase/phosphatase
MCQGLETALTMAPAERSRRMKAMRQRVCSWTVDVWAERFLSALQTTAGGDAAAPPLDSTAVGVALSRFANCIVILDYDGTLVPLGDHPDSAFPDPELLQLLASLSQSNGIAVHVVTGRARETIERWFGLLDISLHAEHGLWSRDQRRLWEQRAGPTVAVPEAVLRLLEDTAERIPGCILEQKSAGVVLHYRRTDRATVEDHMLELRLHLQEMLSNEPIQVAAGSASLELRPSGIGKGDIVQRLRDSQPDAGMLIIGDDRTDEDMFAAASGPTFTFHVGAGPTRAQGRLANHFAVRRMIEDLVLRRCATTALSSPERTIGRQGSDIS